MLVAKILPESARRQLADAIQLPESYKECREHQLGKSWRINQTLDKAIAAIKSSHPPYFYTEAEVSERLQDRVTS